MQDMKQFLDSLSKSFPKKVSISLAITQESADKLYYQERQERDFAALTQNTIREMTQAFIVEYAKEFDKNLKGAVKEGLKQMGFVYKQSVLNRFGSGPKDIALRPLSQQYIKEKGTAKIGINTGDLYRDIKRSKVIIK